MLPKGSGFNVAEGVVGKLESWKVGQLDRGRGASCLTVRGEGLGVRSEE